MRVDLEDWSGVKTVAKYKIFKIGDSGEKYKLTIAGYDNDTSNAGDLFSQYSDAILTSVQVRRNTETIPSIRA